MKTDLKSERRVSTGSVTGLRTNIFLRSEEADNAYWTKSACSATANQGVFVDGLTTMDKIVEDNTTNVHGILVGVGSLVGQETYTISCFVRAAERSAIVMYSINVATWGAHFNLANGATSNFVAGGASVIAKGIENYGNGLYRCWVTGSLNNSATTHNIVFAPEAVFGSESYLGNGTSGILVGGMMLEVGSGVGTYIKSVASQGTAPGRRTRLMGVNVAQGAAASTVRLRNSNASGTILCEIDASAGAAGAATQFIGERGGIVFKDGMYLELNGSPVGVTMTYQA